MGPSDRTLHLVVEAKSRSDLDNAVFLIRKYLDGGAQASPAAVPAVPAVPATKREELVSDGLSLIKEIVFVNMDPMPGFDVKSEISGPSDSFLKHIAAESKARVWIAGLGSVSLLLPSLHQSERDCVYM